MLDKSLYKDTKKNEMSLGICSRSNDVVEPMMKPQWFVNCNTMAKAGLDAVRSKKIEIIPQQYEQDWYRYVYPFCLDEKHATSRRCHAKTTKVEVI
jgi:valyl-tRNA synthetase